MSITKICGITKITHIVTFRKKNQDAKLYFKYTYNYIFPIYTHI